jgi:hypothetical protein
MAAALISGISAVASAMIKAKTFNIGFMKAVQTFAIAAGLTAVSRALAPSAGFDQMRGLNFNVRDPQSPKKIVYGRARLGGTVIAIGSSGSDGSLIGQHDNQLLTLVIAVAGHRIEEFEEIWFNDEKVWDSGYVGDWGSYVAHEFIYGADNDAVSSLAQAGINGWTANHKISGNAGLVIRLSYNAEIFTTGVPNISVVVKGKRIYDPRQDNTSPYYDSSVGQSTQRPDGTWGQLGYSTNPAIVLLDYLRDTKYGLGVDIDDIDLQSIVDAADVCDEDVSLDAGGTQDRYTCNGAIDTANTVKTNAENILTSMIGTLTLTAGKFVVNAHEYRAPSLDIDEDDLIAPLQVVTKQSRRSIYNAVKGSFVSEEDNFVVADYPSQSSSTYATNDGETIFLDMHLPMTTNNIRAQRIARLTMLKSRLQTTVSMRLNLKGLQVRVGDNIRLSNTKLGYTNKVFEIINYTLVPDPQQGLAVEIEARENESAAYSWSTSDEGDFTAGGTVSIYDGKTAQPVTNLVLTASTTVNDDGTVTPSIDVAWDAPDDAFTDRYEITWQNTTDSGSVFVTTTLGSPFVITGLLPGKTYEVKVYAINELGVKSTAVTDTVTSASDFTPKIPSIYRITKTDANAPTSGEFTTAAGRNPKDKDAVITKDTSTTPDSTHAWTYNASTSVWDQDDDLITGDLIVNGTITGDQIKANTIEVNKLTGDVTEIFPLQLRGSTISTSAVNEQEFSIPAPQLGLSKRQRVSINLDVKWVNTNSTGYVRRVDIDIQKKSKGASAVSIGTVTTVTNPIPFNETVYISGNHLDDIDFGGYAADNSSGTGNGSIVELWYDSVNDRTYVTISASSTIFSNGETFYFNADGWTSTGTWLATSYTADPSVYVHGNSTILFSHSMDQTFGRSTTATEFRVQHILDGLAQSGVTGSIVFITGTLENMA